MHPLWCSGYHSRLGNKRSEVQNSTKAPGRASGIYSGVSFQQSERADVDMH